MDLCQTERKGIIYIYLEIIHFSVLYFRFISREFFLTKGEIFMKKIEAIIRPEKFDIIKDALTDLGYAGMSVTEIKGHGNQKGVSEVWRGKRYRVDLLPKIKLEIAVQDEHEEKVIQAIISESQTGSIGDGKIFVSELTNVCRIRTAEEGDAAI